MSYTSSYQDYPTSIPTSIPNYLPNHISSNTPITVDVPSAGTTTIGYEYGGQSFTVTSVVPNYGYHTSTFGTLTTGCYTAISGGPAPYEQHPINEPNFVHDEQEHKIKLTYNETLKSEIRQWMAENVTTSWSMHYTINPAIPGTHDSVMTTMAGTQITSGKMSMVYSFSDIATAALFRLKF